ncbi:MAG: TolC family protein [Victivallaceae bacterium]|nr:TolC family protein [Victivallaceae bacterium]
MKILWNRPRNAVRRVNRAGFRAGWFFLGIVPILIFLSGCALNSGGVLGYREFAATGLDPGFRLLTDKPLLTLEDARAIAMRNNPDYLAAGRSLAAARYRYYQAFGSYFPRVSATAGAGQGYTAYGHIQNLPSSTAPYENTFAGGVSLDATWLLFDSFGREFNVLAMQSKFRETEQLRENVLRLLMRAVAYAYFDIQIAEAQLAIAEANLVYQQSNLEQGRTQFTFGKISRSDLLNFLILTQTARTQVVSWRFQRDVATYALAVLMGYPEGQLPSGLLFEPLVMTRKAFPLPVESYLEQAFSARPDLRASFENMTARRYELYGAYSSFGPSVYGDASLLYSANAGRYRQYSVSTSRWNERSFQYGVRVEYLLFNGLARFNQLRVNRSLWELARYQLDANYLSCVNEVRSAYADCRSWFEQSELFGGIIDWALEQRDLVTVRFWGGEETITRLNEVQSDLVSAQSNFALSLAALRKAQARLAAAINAPIEGISSEPTEP